MRAGWDKNSSVEGSDYLNRWFYLYRNGRELRGLPHDLDVRTGEDSWSLS